MKLKSSDVTLVKLPACAFVFAALAFAQATPANITCPAPGAGCRLALPATGAYLGIFADPAFKDSCTGPINGTPECAIEVREGPAPPPVANLGIGRTFALHMTFPGWSSIPTVLAGNPTCDPEGPVNDFCQDFWHGRVPVIGWACDSSSTTGYTSPQGLPDTNRAVIAGAEDSVIVAAAQALAQYPGPVLLRWFWEFNQLESQNQNCTGYNLPGSPPNLLPSWVYSQFIGAWQHIWNIFHEYGGGNVMFVWDPNNYTPGEWTDPHPYYPGSPYVDWIGIDTFQRATSDTFTSNFEQFYQDFSGIDPATGQPYGKPLMVGANGSQNYFDNNPGPCPLPEPCPLGTELQSTYLAGLLDDLGYGYPKDNLYPLLKAYDYFDSVGNVNWVLDSPFCFTCHPSGPVLGGLWEMAILGSTPQFKATPQVCSVSLNPSAVSVAYGQAVGLTINVETSTPNCPWSVGALPSWITLQSAQSQGQGQNLGPLGPGTVTLHADAPDTANSPIYVYIGGATLTIQVH